MATAIIGTTNKRVIKSVIVPQLPEQGIPNQIYFVPKTDSMEDDKYDEYLWIKEEQRFELIGTASITVPPIEVIPSITSGTKIAEINGISIYYTPYSLPSASSSTLGGVKSSTTGTAEDRDYLVEVNSDGTMKVNVPWVNTTYSVATTTADGLLSSEDKTKLDNFRKLNTISGSTTVTQSLEPNQFYVFNEVEDLTITLSSTEGYADEFTFQFASGATATSLHLPDSIKWVGDNTIESNKTYIVSICNEVAVLGEVSNE